MEYNAKQLQIIQVAERLFAAKGFSGTSIRDIAHEADINVSMISYYFGSKEKLIEALFEVRFVMNRLKEWITSYQTKILHHFKRFIF